MSEQSDNIIPFRRRSPSRGASGKGPESPVPDPADHIDVSGSSSRDPLARSKVEVRTIKPKVPEADVKLSQRLTALRFLSPVEFLTSLANLSTFAQKVALARETDLLAMTLANDHRVFVLAADPKANPENFYRQCYRLKAALDAFKVELGRASIFNVGGITVAFLCGTTSGWHKGRHGEELRLSESFGEADVMDLLRPRLHPASTYEHEVFDVGHRNG